MIVLDKSMLTQIMKKTTKQNKTTTKHFLSSPVFIWKLVLLLIPEFMTFKRVGNAKYSEIRADPACAPLVDFLQP